MISPDGSRFQFFESIDYFGRIWAITHEISAAKRPVIPHRLSFLDAGFERLDI